MEAPPGAGKSTVVPIALLDEPWLRGGKIVMLEPRRLATRAVATRMATTLGESPGETVGYRMRLETRVSKRTRIEVVTEGVFTRMLQSDPALEGVAAVLFDEFHERSLHADTGLAFALDSQENLSPDLRLLVMSATLDGAAVARLLGDAPVVTAAGRVFPVEIHYVGSGMPLLPGGRDAPELACACAPSSARWPKRRATCWCSCPAPEKSAACRECWPASATMWTCCRCSANWRPAIRTQRCGPRKPGRRKIVLATNIAETSLTIDGVRIVVDAGLERRSLFDPASGMNRLEVQRISRASAEQRAGRAGRTAPGVCFRLWGEGAERSLAAFAPPEVCVADLAPLALDLAVWGTEANSLRWLDAPPAATLASARDLLRRLGALDAAGKVTAHGRAMQEFPAHPRLAHMLLKARELEAGSLAAELAALLSDRDLLRAGAGGGPRARDSDIRTRLEALRRGSADIDRGALDRVRRTQRSFEQQLGAAGASRAGADVDAGVLLGLRLSRSGGAAPDGQRSALPDEQRARRVVRRRGVDCARGIHRRRRSRRSGA